MADKTYMVHDELKGVARHIEHLERLLSENGVAATDHVLYDSNGEKIGDVTFSEDANTYVFEYYVDVSEADTPTARNVIR